MCIYLDMQCVECRAKYILQSHPFFILIRGTLSGENAHELTRKLRDLKSELEELEQMEFMLDQQKLWVEQSIRNITEDCSKYPFCA